MRENGGVGRVIGAGGRNGVKGRDSDFIITIKEASRTRIYIHLLKGNS